MDRFKVVIFSIGMLAALLCGCGEIPEETVDVQSGEEENEGTPAKAHTEKENRTFEPLPEGYVLSARFEPVGEGAVMGEACFSGNLLYYEASSYDPEGEYVSGIYAREWGEEARLLLSLGNQHGISWPLMAGEDDSLYFVYGKEEVDGLFQVEMLEKWNRELKKVYSVDLYGGWDGDEAIYSMEAGSDGMLYGLTGRGTVLCWDETGACSKLFNLPVTLAGVNGQSGEPCFGLVNAGNMGVYAYWGGKDEVSDNSIQLYSLKAGKRRRNGEKWMRWAGRVQSLCAWTIDRLRYM